MKRNNEPRVTISCPRNGFLSPRIHASTHRVTYNSVKYRPAICHNYPRLAIRTSFSFYDSSINSLQRGRSENQTHNSHTILAHPMQHLISLFDLLWMNNPFPFVSIASRNKVIEQRDMKNSEFHSTFKLNILTTDRQLITIINSRKSHNSRIVKEG